MTRERFCNKLHLSTVSKTLEAKKVHESNNGVSTIAGRKPGSGLDKLNWQEFVKLPRDIFFCADVYFIVYIVEENGVHAMSAKGDAEFHADDEIERYSEAFFLKNCELATVFTKHFESCQPTCD